MLALILYGSARRSPRLLDYRPLTAGPRLSVIIPARNEAVNIEPCLRSILATAYAPLEVIVVDDRSSDATAKIVARVSATDPRVRLVRGADLPAGWFGKQWALVQGYRAATGALLLFADADTRHTPELIPRALAVLDAERVDLVTVLPRQEMGSFWERLVQPHVFLALQARVGELRLVNRTRRPWNAIANGQFILTPRTVYEAVGTHAAVRETVADDMLLAQRYVAARKSNQAFLPGVQLLVIECVAEGKHWPDMLVLGELALRRCSDTQRRRIGCQTLREAPLQLLQFAKELIVLSVRHRRAVENVVLV